MKNMKRSVALLVAIALLIGCAAGGTMAWLTMKTDSVVNTFTTSDITITLEESDDLDLKMVPGAKIAKDPTVTVTADSEDCYVFVKVEKTGGVVNYTPAGSTEEIESSWDDFLSYTIGDGDTENYNDWVELTDLSDEPKIYYKIFDANSKNVKGTAYSILNSNQVTVKDTVTKEMMDAFDTDKDGSLSVTEKEDLPTLTFTAYAIQKSGFADAATAWGEASK